MTVPSSTPGLRPRQRRRRSAGRPLQRRPRRRGGRLRGARRLGRQPLPTPHRAGRQPGHAGMPGMWEVWEKVWKDDGACFCGCNFFFPFSERITAGCLFLIQCLLSRSGEQNSICICEPVGSIDAHMTHILKISSMISMLLPKKTCLQEPGADLVPVRTHSAWGQPSLQLR